MFTLKNLIFLFFSSVLVMTSQNAVAKRTSIDGFFNSKNFGFSSSPSANSKEITTTDLTTIALVDNSGQPLGKSHVSVLIENTNDCAGYFGGKKGTDCEISHVPTEDSPIFATLLTKYDVEDINFNTTNSDGWNISSDNDDKSSGEWSYSGTEYPNIKFWVAKGSNDFILNWLVLEDNINACDTVFSISCLSAAISVTTGDWTTPVHQQNCNDSGLSHISFYGEESKPGTNTQVPEPSSIILLSLALLGITIRKKSS